MEEELLCIAAKAREGKKGGEGSVKGASGALLILIPTTSRPDTHGKKAWQASLRGVFRCLLLVILAKDWNGRTASENKAGTPFPR